LLIYFSDDRAQRIAIDVYDPISVHGSLPDKFFQIGMI
jgi:hypothetical protein